MQVCKWFSTEEVTKKRNVCIKAYSNSHKYHTVKGATYRRMNSITGSARRERERESHHAVLDLNIVYRTMHYSSSCTGCSHLLFHCQLMRYIAVYVYIGYNRDSLFIFLFFSIFDGNDTATVSARASTTGDTRISFIVECSTILHTTVSFFSFFSLL